MWRKEHWWRWWKNETMVEVGALPEVEKEDG